MCRIPRSPLAILTLVILLAAPVGAESGAPARQKKEAPSRQAITLSPEEERAVEETARLKAERFRDGETVSPLIASKPTPLHPILTPIPGKKARFTVSAPSKNALACTYTGLTSGVVDTVISSPSYYIANQSVGYWTAAAIRSEPGDDWDIHMYTALGTAPACLDSLVAFSEISPGVDVVVADFNHMPVSARYLSALRFAGVETAPIEWEGGPDILTVDGGTVYRATGPKDIIECWDVFLEAGVEYGFKVSQAWPADLKLLLFRNPWAGPYHAGRTSAEIDSSTLSILHYTAPSDDWYCVVIVNENGLAGNYTLEVGSCSPPIALTSTLTQSLPNGIFHLSFDQQDPYWAAVVARPDVLGSDLVLRRYTTGSGASWPVCYTSETGISMGYTYESHSINMIVADFNSGGDTLGAYPMTLTPWSPDTSGASIEWDAGADLIFANGAPIAGATVPTDVVEIWDIYLKKNVPYQFYVTTSGSAEMMSLLFSRPELGPVVTTLAWPTDIGACRSFVGLSTGYHGLAMINFNGGTASYQFAVSEQFVDEADALFRDQASDGRGFGWSDYDLDGDLDVYVTNYGDPDRLLENDGAGVFTDITAPPLGNAGPSLHPVWGDFDNDGDPDLLVTTNNGPLSLYRNEGGGVFSDITSSPLSLPYTGTQASWIDFDNDGFLDISLANGLTAKLFGGAGDGTFADATPAIVETTTAERHVWGDFDHDGDLDLYNVSYSANHLLRNEGNGLFSDVTTPPLDDARVGYDGAWSDFDLDGDLDLVVVNENADNLLFRNEGGGSFADVSTLLPSDTLATRGVMWGDYDNNGYPDLFMTTFIGPNKLLAGLLGEFSERAATEVIVSDASVGSAWVDYDSDGDLDLSVINLPAFGSGENQQIRNDLCTTNGWLKVDLTGILSNRDGIGARVTVYSFGEAYIREITGKSASYGSGPLIAQFGLPYSDLIDSVVVDWPRGARQTIVAPGAWQTIEIIEDISYYVGVNDTDDSAPAARLVLHENVPNPFNPMTTIRFDLPADGKVTLAVYDVSGRLVRTLVGGQPLDAGHHDVTWDGTDDGGTKTASGIYFYRLQLAGESRTRKMVMIR